jgi:hypothetical protein
MREGPRRRASPSVERGSLQSSAKNRRLPPRLNIGNNNAVPNFEKGCALRQADAFPAAKGAISKKIGIRGRFCARGGRHCCPLFQLGNDAVNDFCPKGDCEHRSCAAFRATSARETEGCFCAAAFGARSGLKQTLPRKKCPLVSC